jgi:hypothetical protein
MGGDVMAVVYQSDDGTIFSSTVGWRLDHYGRHPVLSRVLHGDLDAELAAVAKCGRGNILVQSVNAIAKLVRQKRSA